MSSLKAINQIEEYGTFLNVASSKPERDLLGLVLILLSSILLGIWAVKGTIALRNILLGVETVLSILYCYRFFKTNTQKIPLRNWLPIIMLGMMFCWVILHYFLLSRFPDIQLHELKSTWLRSLLASVVGFGTGLAVLRRPNAVTLLWLGILFSFMYLFYQYIPLVISNQSTTYHHYHHPINEQFIFPGKISGVLAGTILISGLLGSLFDRYSYLSPKSKFILIFLCFLSTVFTLYAYVYIFDTRNGIGLTVIVIGLTLFLLFCQVSSSLRNLNLKKVFLHSISLGVFLTVVSWFVWDHFKLNPGWASMVADASIAVQIEKYPNWQSPQELGYPINGLGDIVKGNTYERIGWATAGIIIFIPENPFGVGILSKPFGVLLNAKYPSSANYILSSHSAWVELTLAFGVPAIIFTLGALLSILALSIASRGPLKYLQVVLSFTIAILYAVGELSSKHSIEMLFFLIAFLSACLIHSNIKKLKNQ
jgi:hypothetical protein